MNIPVPSRMEYLPRDVAGRPIPWFSAVLDDGTHDARVADYDKWGLAVRAGLCWVCGKPLGGFKAFAVGPMCALNRISGEPPQHLECAEYSARACPFMANPKRRRRKSQLPEGVQMSDFGLERNPGAVLVWTTRVFNVIRDPSGGRLIEMGPPTSISWWCEGRPAVAQEVNESIESGLLLLRGMDPAMTDEDEAGLRRKWADLPI